MKNEFKISSIAVACVLCLTASAAYSASSVRALGGTGTYTSASAASGGSSGSVAAPSVARSGSVRVNSTVNKGSSATTTGTNTSRVVTMPRLSIGNYLGGGTSISGGSSLRPMQPGGGSSSSSGGGDVDPGIVDQVDALERRVDGLETKYDDVSNSLFDKQDTLNPVDEYVIVEGADISIDIEKLKQDIEAGTGQTGNVEIGNDGTGLQYRVGDGAWEYIITYAELATKGGYALKADLADKADKAELDNYSTTTEMNLAISDAVAAASANFATKEDLAGLATKEELATKANAADVYKKSETYDSATIDEKIAQAATGGEVDLSGYAKTQYVDEELAKKADVQAIVDMLTKTEAATTYATTGQVASVSSLAQEAQAEAEAAKSEADKANQALANKADKTALESLATKEELANKADASALAAKEDASNKATTIDDGNQSSSALYPSVGAIVQWTNDKINALSTEGLPVNPDNIGAGAITTEKIADDAVTEDKLSNDVVLKIDGKADTSYVDAQLELKADKTELDAYAKKGEIKDADIAADAAISKTKLAQDVQESLNKADAAVSMQGAENSSVLGTDENGDTVWYKIAI